MPYKIPLLHKKNPIANNLRVADNVSPTYFYSVFHLYRQYSTLPIIIVTTFHKPNLNIKEENLQPFILFSNCLPYIDQEQNYDQKLLYSRN